MAEFQDIATPSLYFFFFLALVVLKFSMFALSLSRSLPKVVTPPLDHFLYSKMHAGGKVVAECWHELSDVLFPFPQAPPTKNVRLAGLPLELDHPGPSGVSSETPLGATGGGATTEVIEDVPISASLRKLGNLGIRGNLAEEPLEGNRVMHSSTVARELSGDVVCHYCGSDMVMSKR